jgi:predicted transcriptional regulator YheO
MSEIHPILKSMIPLADAIAKMVGPNCEVAIHDLTHPQHSIFHIVNVHLSGRKEGDTLGGVFKEFIQIAQLNQDMIVNYYDFENGITSKCTKVLIKDEGGKAIGCFCINIVIDSYMMALTVLQQICETTPIEVFKGESVDVNENNDISQVVKDLISNTYTEAKKSQGKLTRAEKIEIVSFLDEKGIFRVKGSVEWVAKTLKVSRFTVYNYLDQIRS